MNLHDVHLNEPAGNIRHNVKQPNIFYWIWQKLISVLIRILHLVNFYCTNKCSNIKFIFPKNDIEGKQDSNLQINF